MIIFNTINEKNINKQSQKCEKYPAESESRGHLVSEYLHEHVPYHTHTIQTHPPHEYSVHTR